MKLKLFIFVFTALILSVVASAAQVSISPDTLIFNSNLNSVSFAVSNTNSTSLLNVNIPSTFSIQGENSYVAVFNIAGESSNINSSSPKTFTITPQGSIDFSEFNFEKLYSTNILVFNVANPADNRTLLFKLVRNSFCSNGRKGNLNLDVDITNNGEFGGEESIWYPFETIKASVNVENTGNDKINDIVLHWGLYNKRTGEYIIDEEEKSFDLKEDKDNTVDLEFKIDPNDLDPDDGEDDFLFFVRAYSEDLGESSQCDFYTNNIQIPRDEDFVILGDLNIPETVQCGETLNLNFKLWNIGDNNEQDVSVVVTSRNLPSLKTSKTISVGDIDIFESKRESVEIEIPKNLTEGVYELEFRVLDEDNNVFQNDEDEESHILYSFKVQGNCEIPKSVSITAALDSEAVAGQEMVVKANVKNTGQADTTYLIQPSGYDSWAILKSVSDTTTSLKPGESKEVLITLIPNKNSAGEREFTIKTIYGNLETSYKVKSSIEPPKSFFSSLTNFSFSGAVGENWFIWVVAALNIVLVVLIVVIAIRIAKK